MAQCFFKIAPTETLRETFIFLANCLHPIRVAEDASFEETFKSPLARPQLLMHQYPEGRHMVRPHGKAQEFRPLGSGTRVPRIPRIIRSKN